MDWWRWDDAVFVEGVLFDFKWTFWSMIKNIEVWRFHECCYYESQEEGCAKVSAAHWFICLMAAPVIFLGVLTKLITWLSSKLILREFILPTLFNFFYVAVSQTLDIRLSSITFSPSKTFSSFHHFISTAMLLSFIDGIPEIYSAMTWCKVQFKKTEVIVDLLDWKFTLLSLKLLYISIVITK